MEIDYISGAKTEEMFGISKYQFEIHKRLEKVITINQIQYSQPNSTIGNIWAGLFYYPLVVKKKIKKDNVKHIPTIYYTYINCLVDLKKTIATCYDLFIPWINTSSLKHYWWKLRVSGLKKSEKIITISNFTKREIVWKLEFPEDRIHVVYEGVDILKYKPSPKNHLIQEKYGLPSDKNIVLYVGSEQPRKNVSALIKAFALARRKNKDIFFLKIGRPQWKNKRQQLISLIHELEIDNNVLIIDYVEEKDLPAIYNLCDLVVIPTLAEGGTSMPVLEAMACGTPVITSNIPPLVETIGPDNVLMTDPLDTKELADAIIEMLNNNSLRNHFIEKGMNRTKQLSWENAAQETLKIYQSMMD